VTENSLLVTGASSEIGRALIRRLAQRPDCPLILAHYRNGAGSIRELQADLGGDGRIVPLQADFHDPAAVAQMAERVLADFGPPRAVVHLPATPLRYERFRKMDWARLEEDFAIQVHSITILLQKILPELRRSLAAAETKPGKAHIVFVLSSVTLGLPPKHLTSYTVVKSALLGLMRSLAVEYGAEGVNVNAVSPSMVETQFLREIPALAVESAAQAHPLRRNATPEDICGAIEFLLSSSADFLNGVNLPVAGGLLV
jgi:3-oxoacyl-[acyl-carrier protein] reductase